MNILKNIDGSTIYVSEGLPIGTKDGEGRNIGDGSVCVDRFNKFIYKLVSKKWTLQTTDASLNVTTSTYQTNSSILEDWYGTKLFNTKSKVKYTTTYNGSTTLNYVLPNAHDNVGKFIAIEDTLGLGICVLNSNRTSTLYGFGGLGNGQVSTMYLYSDGDAWNIATIYLPIVPVPTTITTNTIYVDNDNGNDSTGAKYDSAKPYKTVSQALFVAVSGDVIYIKAGNYIDYNMDMKNGVEIYMEKNAIISPTANNGYVPIFKNYRTGYSSGLAQTFKIYGKGKLINKAGTSSSGVCSIENHSTMNVFLEAEEVSILSIYANALGSASFTIYNTLISMELYTRGGMWSLNNCVIKDCKTTTFNMDWGGAQVQFNNCIFIRQQVLIPFEQPFNANIIGQNTINISGTQGLTNFAFGPTVSNGSRKTSFIDCTFYNLIGGDGITFRNSSSNNAVLVVSGCRFYSSDNTKKALLADGVSGTPTTPNYYFDNNISNIGLGTVNGGVLTNLLSGTGFQTVSTYFIANPLPYTSYGII